MNEQLTFLASLDFPGRTTLTVAEIAERLGYTEQHIADLIDEDQLGAVDGRGKGAGRSAYRVPVECYRDFISARLRGPARTELLANLPEITRSALILELFSGLPAAARSGILARLRTALAA